MIIILFTILFMLGMFNCFTVSFHLQNANKAVIYTPIEVFEASLVVVNRNDETNLYFDRLVLSNNLSNYYSKTISNYLDSYSFNLYFYNPDNGSICLGDNCNAVEVSVSGTYMQLFNYSRKIKYEIKKGYLYGE